MIIILSVGKANISILHFQLLQRAKQSPESDSGAEFDSECDSYSYSHSATPAARAAKNEGLK